MQNQTIVRKIEEQVYKFPQELALVSKNSFLTYSQLNSQANLLANHLLDINIPKNTLVGIVLSRSKEFIIAALGILKARCCYIPIDPSFPKERIESIIHDAQLSIIITTKDLCPQLKDINNLKLIDIESLNDFIAKPNFLNPSLVSDPDDQIYVIYTSGSTGKPKGAINKHCGFLNLVDWYVNRFGMSPKDRILIFTALSFDLTQKNIFAPLAVGAKLYLLEDTTYDPELIINCIDKYKITWINCTPSAFYPLIEENAIHQLEKLSTLRYVFVGGEPLHAKRLRSIKDLHSHIQIINTYGPTECADVCAFYPLSDKDYDYPDLYVPIGKAIPNMNLNVFNKKMQQVSTGEIGELYISGIGVGAGYLNNPHLTESAFIKEYSSSGISRLLYKTGDIVRYSNDDNIEFIERKDFQVKIRGYRVEIAEIINAIKTYPGVSDTLVVVHENKDHEKYLVAYVVGLDSQEIAHVNNIKEHLGNILPSYMIPFSIMLISNFPLTLNGKIDRSKLPVPQVNFIKSNMDNLNPVEQKLYEIWSELLPDQIIDTKDSFFVLGGHSLSAVKLISRIRQIFNLEVYIIELFNYPTIESLSKFIADNNNSKRANGITVGPVKSNHEVTEYLPSYPHKRIIYITKHFQNPIIFNNLVTLLLKGPLSVDSLESAFQKLIDRHEIFRTYLDMEHEEPHEKVVRNLSFKIERVNFSNLLHSEQQSKVFAFSQSIISIPFKLDKLPLIRAYILKLADDEHVLVMSIHQFLIDGSSMDIFYDELSIFYHNILSGAHNDEVSPLTIEYKDYAIWQNAQLTDKNLVKEIEFWKNNLKDAPEKNNFPTDKSRPECFSYNGNVHTSFLSTKNLIKVNRFYKANNATLFMVLLAVYAVILQDRSKDRVLIIGAPTANRRFSDLEPLIGFFINLIPYKIEIEPEISFYQLMDHVKRISLEAYEHEDLPFIKLPDYLGIERRSAFHPVFQVAFAMQPYGVEKLILDNIVVKDLDYEEPIAKFDLTLNVSLKKEGLELKFEYATDLFHHSTIDEISNSYRHILMQAIENPNLSINQLVMFNTNEVNFYE